MRNRVLLSAGAIALLAASCAQPEPQVLSEAPRSASTADLTSPSQAAGSDAQSGRFIARCATEADGGTPGMTFFTDGSQNVTDHCLSRYYIGVQPAPGALYVPDEEAGSLAPSTHEGEPGNPSGTTQWTPAQPRTDSGPEETTSEDEDGRTGEETSPAETSTPGPDGTETTTTSPDGAPSSPTTTTPDQGENGATAPGAETPGGGETSPTSPGSTETDLPTEVPTITQPPAVRPGVPPTSVSSTRPSGPFGWISSHS